MKSYLFLLHKERNKLQKNLNENDLYLHQALAKVL